MSQTLSKKQKQLLIDILENPTDIGAKKAYSSWLYDNKHEQQAQAVDWIINDSASSRPKNFIAGKKEFVAAIMKSIGLNPDPNHHSFGFSIKVDGEKLLKSEDFFELEFKGGKNEVSEFTALRERITEAAGKNAMISLAAAHINDGNLQRKAKGHEHALYKFALDSLADKELSNERKVTVAQAIYDKTVNPHFPEHTVAARIMHGITESYPEKYENGYGKRTNPPKADDVSGEIDVVLDAESHLSHHNRIKRR